VAVGVAAVAAAAVVVLLTLSADGVYQRNLRLALLLWCTLPFIAAGMLAWRRRPDSRFGPLLIAAGFVTPASVLQLSSQPVPSTVGQLCERVLVAAGYVAAIGLQVVVLALGGFGGDNLLAVTQRPHAAETVQNVQLLTLATLCVAGAVLLWVRLVRRRPRPRRTAAWLAVASGVALVMAAALLVAGTFALPGFGSCGC
jgi:hypothetical protein